MTAHGDDSPYRAAKAYDVAFGFKDVVAECDTLADCCRRHFRAPRSFLEIAAGPASNAVEMARRGLRSTALDLSDAMIAYAHDRAEGAGVGIGLVEADMRAFSIPEVVDLAAMLMDSASHLLEDDDVLRHLRCVARALEPGGIYVLEMSHPRDVFGVGKSVQTTWEAEQGGTWVRTTWGEPGDRFDPITQVTRTTTTLEWRDGGESGVVKATVPLRRFTFHEIATLVKLSGCFEIVEVLGALKPDVPFTNEKSAWRMVPVLRKKGS